MKIAKLFNLTNLTLLTALSLSAIAAWYSILGLTAIFAAAAIPIIIMGSALEIAKVVTTIWLHKFWHKATLSLKLYLVPAVIALALLTSMGVFGFLSKAHIDQGVPTGDIAAKVALIDEKIKIQKENITTARAALAQMDAQINARLDRGNTEQGAERAVQIRRQQQAERNKLLKEINEAQTIITKLNEERAPIASELRKVEAEVGPVKYIAALIYGDNTDQTLLESAVRWVIILIVLVFDPLALVLVLAANSSRVWEKQLETQENTIVEPTTTTSTNDVVEPIKEDIKVENSSPPIQEDTFNIKDHPYLSKPWAWFTPGEPIVSYTEKPQTIEVEQPISKEEENQITTDLEISVSDDTPIGLIDKPEIVTSGITKEISANEKTFTELSGDYVNFEGKQMHKEALKSLHPELFIVKPDSSVPSTTDFGVSFPGEAKKGQIFVRVDILPNRVYKFDGSSWIEVKKDQSDTYLHNQEYIKYLVEKIEKGEYDVDLLSETEKEEIAQYLGNQKS